jgi:hypothetical protein
MIAKSEITQPLLAIYCFCYCFLYEVLHSKPKFEMEEGMGFEPTVHCCTPAFQAGTFNHSATLP